MSFAGDDQVAITVQSDGVDGVGTGAAESGEEQPPARIELGKEAVSETAAVGRLQGIQDRENIGAARAARDEGVARAIHRHSIGPIIASRSEVS